MATTRFGFRFAPAFRLAGLPFGVMPRTTEVSVDATHLHARFGPWRVDTELSNIAGTQITGPYDYIKTAGPARLSFSDRGLTFATNRERGLCIQFHEAVSGMAPGGVLRHPGLTVTVADPEGLAMALAR